MLLKKADSFKGVYHLLYNSNKMVQFSFEDGILFKRRQALIQFYSKNFGF